jgi:NADH-quinone oxidoreductase subunit A
MVSDYIYFLSLSFIAGILSVILLGLSVYLGSIQYPSLSLDKLMAFECGFVAFKDSRSKFNISYYLLGILFLVFDLEIIHLLR